MLHNTSIPVQQGELMSTPSLSLSDNSVDARGVHQGAVLIYDEPFVFIPRIVPVLPSGFRFVMINCFSTARDLISEPKSITFKTVITYLCRACIPCIETGRLYRLPYHARELLSVDKSVSAVSCNIISCCALNLYTMKGWMGGKR